MSVYKEESYAYLHYHVFLCIHIDLRQKIYGGAHSWSENDSPCPMTFIHTVS
jgi:hypothetical protein